jgi:hypothetical protein
VYERMKESDWKRKKREEKERREVAIKIWDGWIK